MTIRLLYPYDPYPVNAVVKLDAGLEASLLAAGLADSNLTAGTAYATAPSTALANAFRRVVGDAVVLNTTGTRVAGRLEPDGTTTWDSRVLANVRAALAAGSTASLMVQGDSTGNDDDEWVMLVTQAFAAQYPTAHVKYSLWNDVNQDHDAWRVVQAGSGERHALMNNSRTFFTPLAAFTAITGDIDVRIRVSLDTWADGTARTFMARYGAAGQRAWRLGMNTSNRLFFAWTADGTNESTAGGNVAATGPVPFANGDTGWLRATLDVDNGGGGRTVSLYYSLDGATWTSLGVSSGGVVASIFDANLTDYEIGGRGSNGELITGKIYEAQIRNGIGGPIVNPQPIEAWMPRTASGQGAGTFGGGPTLYVINASRSGANLTYLTDTTRFPMMMPPFIGATVFQSCCHNDYTLTNGLAYQALRDGWLSQMKTRLPMASFVLVTQNPEMSPSTLENVYSHARRRLELMGWARRNGVEVVDTYGAIVSDPRGAAFLTKVDGIHPTAAGSQLWADEVLSA